MSPAAQKHFRVFAFVIVATLFAGCKGFDASKLPPVNLKSCYIKDGNRVCVGTDGHSINIETEHDGGFAK